MDQDLLNLQRSAMGILEHIKLLLRDHDRAFIPGFGGFVKERVPARIDRDRHLFLPPGCTLLFNRQLDKEDGLLAERLMEEEGLSFEKAKEKVRGFALSSKEELERKKRLEWEGIGILYKDEEGKTRFEPDPDPELELSAYGLSSFFVSPIAKGEHDEPAEEAGMNEEEHEGVEEGGQEEAVPLEAKEGARWPLRIAAALIPLLLLGGGYLALRSDAIREGSSFSELLPAASSGESAYTPRGTELPELSFKLEEKEEQDPPFPFHFEEGGPVYTVYRERTEPAAPELGKSYFVVGGCFQEENNAKTRVKELERKGFDARILGRKRKGLHVVAFDAYAERAEALRGLTRAQHAMPEAWLLQRP